ncbi:hypothetical protein Tsubulata_015202 [Turnera subulata]|uniref:40S ribosomal protein S11 N-terminal domain-containing protein n=1 Tax=Turnera subulata TaxID=218843 RepID=A0A9Q0FAL2_9ROSI|nr:hypothetical protein Tsubulata_015202 [Turnera subulata]
MAEQTEKAFLKQPKGKGTDLEREAIASGRALVWDLRPQETPLKGLILIRSAPLLELFPLEAVSLLVLAIVPRCRGPSLFDAITSTTSTNTRGKRRHSNIPAHISPCFRVKEGDHVIIGQCRPLSKTVRFNVLKVIPAGSSGGGKKAFTGV